jgi:abequosyltransferase
VPPVLSVCIPTHAGRAEVLRGALDSILGQVDDALRDQVEVCVSDNASEDGTAAMVEELRDRAPVPIVYSRNATDIGLGANMMRVVELASGDWCWLFGSDDEMAEGGLRHVLGLLKTFPDVSGVSVNWANFGADMQARGQRDGSGHFPLPLTTRRYDGVDEVIENVGLLWGYTSAIVVRRRRWLDAAAEVGERALTHPTWPQVRILGEVARRDPAWVYAPHVVVRNRTSASWMYERDAGSHDPTRMHIDLIDGIDAVLGDLVGKGTRLHRELMTRMYWAAASGRVVGQIKRFQGAAGRGEVELARSLLSAFWWLPAFWTGAAPQLLVPGAVAARLAHREARRGGPGPLPAAACRTRVDARLPAVFPTRHELDLRCTLHNAGTAPLVSSGPHPVRLAYRWFDDTRNLVLEGMRADLARPLAPGASTRLLVALLTPWEEGDYELRIAPVQEEVRWFDDADPANGIRVRARVRHPE